MCKKYHTNEIEFNIETNRDGKNEGENACKLICFSNQFVTKIVTERLLSLYDFFQMQKLNVNAT